MQALIELIAGFIALLAAVALAQFGVDLSPPRDVEREVRRFDVCREAPASTGMQARASRRC